MDWVVPESEHSDNDALVVNDQEKERKKEVLFWDIIPNWLLLDSKMAILEDPQCSQRRVEHPKPSKNDTF